MKSYCTIKNISSSSKTIHGKTFSAGESYAIPEDDQEAWSIDTEVTGAIKDRNFNTSLGARYASSIIEALTWLRHYSLNPDSL